MSVKTIVVTALMLVSAMLSAQRDTELETLFNRDITPEEREKVNEKIHDFSQQIKLEPENYMHYYNRGVMYGRLGLHNDAITDYNKVLQLKNDLPQAYYNRGLSRARFGYTKTACMDIKKAAELGFTQAGDLYKNKCGLHAEELGELP